MEARPLQLDPAYNLDVPSYRSQPPQRPWTAERLLGLFKRRRWVLLLPSLLLALVGVAYVLQREPIFTASGRVLIENVQFEAGRPELLPTRNTVETSTLESHAELLKSETLALKVIERLRLKEDPEFRKPSGLLSIGWQLVREAAGFQPAEGGDEDLTSVVLGDFQSRLRVRRIGTTTVLEVQFKASDPNKAALIVNEVFHVHLAEQVAATAAAANAASAWLRERIKDLGAKTRIIDVARRPLHKDGPRGIVVIAVFAGLGLLLGCAAAVLRELVDGSLRDPLEVRALVGGTFLGGIGALAGYKASRLFGGSLRLRDHLKEAVFHPGSDLAHVARRMSVVTQGVGPIIGVQSTVAGEGTTTVAANFAAFAAQSGRRVLLVDANPNKHLSHVLTPETRIGFTDVVAGTVSLANATVEVEKLPLSFVPFGNGSLLVAPSLQGFAEDAGRNYELVVVDLAPAGAETGSFDCLNGLVLVVEWGRTPATIVESSVADGRYPKKTFLGFVFNKVRRSKVDVAAFPVELQRWKRQRRRR